MRAEFTAHVRQFARRHHVRCYAASAFAALACSAGSGSPGPSSGGAGQAAGSANGGAPQVTMGGSDANSSGGASVATASGGTSALGGTGGAGAGNGASAGGAGASAAGSGSSPDGGRIGIGGSSGGALSGGAAGTSAGGSGAGGTSGTSTLKIFEQIPQFGIYATRDPKYTPPAGVLMWSYGTVFLVKLSEPQKAAIRAKLSVRLTYHAQCDNYDRIGSLFFLTAASGQMPAVKDQRVELVRYITPFSDYMRGALATYVYPEADISAYASTLADASKDVWVGIVSGANPYDGDPCTNAQVTPEFREVGYKFSVEFLSSGAAVPAVGTTLAALSHSSQKKVPIAAAFDNSGEVLDGRITVIISGHGSDSGGVEYSNTRHTVLLGGTEIGSFETKIDCASYEKYSPDGNPGIFRSNTSTNPRNWCPGALVPAHTFPAMLKSGMNDVSIKSSKTDVPSGSFYATTINFTAP